MGRKYKATYPSGRSKIVVAKNIEKARDKIFTQDGKLKYKTLERVNPRKPRRFRLGGL